MNEALSRALFDQQTKGISERVLQLNGWKLWVREFPVLEVSFVSEGRLELRLRMLCDGWNEKPPSVELLAPDGARLVSLDGYVKAGQFNNSRHDDTGYPFICMIGSREYHNHSSHRTDLWENYRHNNKYTLDGILFQLWSAWKKGKP